MKSYSLHEGLLYPGAYTPRAGTERRIAIFRSNRRKTGINSPVELKEYPSSYRLEISLAGAQREDILLFAEDNTLIIDVLNDDEKEKRITLPESADLEFVCAEFRKGILQIHIPRSRVKAGNVKKEIVVY
jgi:HSP20 family molecular chaperone IbpA